MAFSAVGCLRQLTVSKNRTPLIAGALTLRCRNANIQFIQAANITSAGGEPWERQRKPFDYRNRVFTALQQPFDKTLKRMDENSKVIIIDGPIASGKHEFAKSLARELDFKYVPQAKLEYLYRRRGGAVLGLTDTDLDELMEPGLRVYTEEMFMTDKIVQAKDGGRGGELQMDYMRSRLRTYNDSLLHLLSTGELCLLGVGER